MLKIIVLILISGLVSFAQSIELNGSILQKEYTEDNKISGFITYLNNSSVGLELEIIDLNDPKNLKVKNISILANSGKQIKILKQEFGGQNKTDFISGNFELCFIYKINQTDQSEYNILAFKNFEDSPPTLRGISITINELNDDSSGEYFEIKINWKTIYDGAYSETRKCYITKGDG